ncbi:MAG: alpha/beta hydrolase [Chloroflexota bacterium]
MPAFQRGDVTLHYELDGQGEDAVYISGLGSHSNDILGGIMRQGIASKYRVLSVDNRGSGQTMVNSSSTTTIEDMADDIAALMDAQGMGAANVAGVSMGGCIALTLAVRHPEKVRRLVVAVSFAKSNPTPNRAEFMLQTLWAMRDRGVPHDLISRYDAVMLLSEDVFRYGAFIDAWVNAPEDPSGQTRAGFDLQTGALRTYDVLDAIRNIRVPTLVISSPDDMLVPPRFQDEIHAAIPNSEIKRYPGGHVFFLLPMYTAQFVEDILGFWGK